ncbi:heterogeneous nuclear ribonucleoprotein 27C [Caerostris darwini]|uniref:Heterogeneous nuclear ribonucleoprotein 27C n=1 Tax=Caerostris darwini TaxID=1538125 RepID=A0AAV4T6K0_9ARAC|nr:heterogeneous nuclear ribonucleoprotein 27C [Caerostris darwini]
MTMTETDDVGKLFVGGLSWETSKETLQSYFSRFGEVVDSVVMKNNETGRSRGFGFVTFKDPGCVSAVLQSKPHEINGRTVDAKECTPRSLQRNRKGPSQCKVFLGGLPPDITETDIRSALSKFGKVNQVTIMCDQETKKCRGFGFLSFELEDSIDQACAQRFVNINGKQVECKKAEPRENNQRRVPGQPYGMNQNGMMRQGGYGPGPVPGYQPGWNQNAQPYGQGYGNYQGYNAMGGNSYPTVPYNTMAPSSQFPAQSAYPNYGYGYTQQPAGNYAQAVPTAYSQPQAANYPATAAATSTNAQDAVNAYPQNAPAFGPTKSFGSTFQKDQISENGPGYQAPAAASRGQGYHPYRR